MPKKLTIFGALLALVFGAMAVFHGTASATDPVQNFDSTGTYTLNAGTCWDTDTTANNGEQHPSKTGDMTTGGQIICGPGTVENHLPLGTGAAVRSFTYIQLPQGNRLTLPVTYTPSGAGQFGVDASKAVCGTPVAGDCGAGSSTTGAVSAMTDLFCNAGAYDILASAKGGSASTTSWPSDPANADGWTGFDFTRSADNGLTGVPGGANAYVNQIKPFPASFPFVSLDTASLTKLFLAGGGGGFTLPTPTPLQLYTATSAYVANLNVSVALLGGNPGSPPTNDYLCLDSPQNSETSTEYVTPPTSNGLFPRWVVITSAADFVNGDVSRILDLQCVGVGTVTSGAGATDVGATDADDDCLATPADANDGDPDQDDDGLPDGVEAFGGSSQTAADADGDGASDYTEMFTFTDPNDSDTDNDGSLDQQDNGADEVVGSLVVDDTIADDNCPAVANADQLNTDSAASYHGGNVAWDNTNAGNNGVGVPPATDNHTWTSASIVVTTGPAKGTITLTAPSGGTSGLVNNQLIEISGVTGKSGGTAADSNAYVTGINGVFQVKTPTATTFTVNLPTLAPAITAGTVTGTVIIRPATGDATNPDQDTAGDACDTDNDNDGLTDVAEPNVTYTEPWAGGAATSCVGDGTGAPPVVVLNPNNGDSDQDLVLDGAECAQGSRPDVSNKAAPYNCVAASKGCAQPKNAAAGEDPDADKLYISGAAQTGVELFYHTEGINQNDKSQVIDIDGDGDRGVADKDSDADWNIAALAGKPWVLGGKDAGVSLQDGIEVRFTGTEPSNADTDTDGCDDAREVGDVNGDRNVNPGDQATIANRLTQISNLDNGKAGDPTANDGASNPNGVNYDQNGDRQINPGDQALASFLVSKGGACQTTRQQGKSVGNATKLPF